MSVLFLIRKTLIILVSFALLAVLVLIAGVKQEIKHSAAASSGFYTLRIWAETQDRAGKILDLYRGNAFRCRVLEGVKPEGLEGGYIAVKDFPEIKTFNRTFNRLKELGYQAQSLPSGENLLRMQAGEAFAGRQAAQDFCRKIAGETGEKFSVERETRRVATPGYWVTLENLKSAQLAPLKAQAENSGLRFEVIPEKI